ncbi:MAG: PEP-CTERM sorting domain-containing protein [Phycisphaerae bacterium]
MFGAIAGAGVSHAAVIANFEFDGTAASLNSTIDPAGASVGTFGVGPNNEGATFDFASRFGSNQNFAYWIPQGPSDASPGAPGGTGDGVYTAADNLADGEYMTFTIEADAGNTLNLSDISFRAARNGGGGAINRLDLYVSVDDGAFTKVGDTLSTGDTSNPSTTIRDLSGGAFQDVQKAQFAFVFFNGNNGRGYIDDIALDGEVVIPEPASLSMLGLGSLALLRRTR